MVRLKALPSKTRLRVPASPRLRIGVDTGGTFTDFVFELAGRREIFKLPSTPGDPSLAVTAGISRILKLLPYPLRNIEIMHGTTVGTNALLATSRRADGFDHDRRI